MLDIGLNCRRLQGFYASPKRLLATFAGMPHNKSMAYEFIKSPNFTPNSAVASNYGLPRTFKAITIHWWGDPAQKPAIAGVISHFRNPQAQVSAHYVVNDSRTVQMVSEGDAAWHAKQANPYTIGIECDPNGGEAMYQRLGELVKDIRNRRGYLPLNRHSIYVQTACPGTIDLTKIDNYASNNPQGETNVDYKKAWEDATRIATEREDYLNKIAFAEGSGSGAIERDDVDRIIAGIDQRNKRIEALEKQLGTVATELKPGTYIVR